MRYVLDIIEVHAWFWDFHAAGLHNLAAVTFGGSIVYTHAINN